MNEEGTDLEVTRLVAKVLEHVTDGIANICNLVEGCTDVFQTPVDLENGSAVCTDVRRRRANR